MKSERKYRGFSLTEVLLAVGTFAIGMIFVAGVFPVAIHFTTIATERTISAVAADEAFAKIRLYAIGDPANPNDDIDPNGLPFNQQTPIELVPVKSGAIINIDPNEFEYTSTSTNPAGKRYYWSALCRRVDVSNVQVTVFVSRKAGSGTTYVGQPGVRPVPVQVGISNVAGIGNENKLTINVPGEETLINDGYTIVENGTGQIYRVLERYVAPSNMIELDRAWQVGNSVWVVPPPIGGGRYPCIVIYQRVIGF